MLSCNAVADVRPWLESDAVLTGAGGERISALRRSYQGGTSKSLEALVRSVSDDLMIRPTGHSWCLSGRSPTCGGRGLYDPPHCVSCTSGVIGKEHLDFWGELRLQQLEALRLADSGPGGMAAIISGVQACDEVIGTLLNFKVTYGNRGSTPDRRHAAQTTNRARQARCQPDDKQCREAGGGSPQHHSHALSRHPGPDSRTPGKRSSRASESSGQGATDPPWTLCAPGVPPPHDFHRHALAGERPYWGRLKDLMLQPPWRQRCAPKDVQNLVGYARAGCLA